MKKSNIFIIVASVVIYSIILGCIGAFGNGVKNILLMVMPYIGIAIGYFFVIFLPIRIIQALNRNSQLRNEYEKDIKLENYRNSKKELENNIKNLLSEKDRL